MGKSDMERKAVVQKIMLGYSLDPSLSGFSVLADVIILALHHPELKCIELFELYSAEKKNSGLNGMALYKQSNYCVLSALSPYKGTWRFIKGILFELEMRELSER